MVNQTINEYNRQVEVIYARIPRLIINTFCAYLYQTVPFFVYALERLWVSLRPPYGYLRTTYTAADTNSL